MPARSSLGAPFDGGTSHRPGTRFGPQAIRFTDYLAHDGMRPHLALGVDPLSELPVVDAGDVHMLPGEIEQALRRLEQAVTTIAQAGPIPVVLGGDHTITFPDATGVARHVGWGRVALVHFDAHADTADTQYGSLYGHGTPMRRLIESGAVRGDRFFQIGLRGYWPPEDVLEWMAGQNMRSYEMTEVVERGLNTCLDEVFGLAMDGCDAVFLSVDIDVVDPGSAPGHRHSRTRGAQCSRHCSMPSGELRASSPWAGSTWSRSPRRTTTPRSPPTLPTGSSWKPSRVLPGGASPPAGGAVRLPSAPLLQDRPRPPRS